MSSEMIIAIVAIALFVGSLVYLEIHSRRKSKGNRNEKSSAMSDE